MVATALAVTQSDAVGQDLQPEDDVTRVPVGERPHPEFDPIGYRTGSVFFYPKLTGGLIYNSNVYARPDRRQADFAALLSPELKIKADHGVFSYQAAFGADIYRFRELTSENRIDAKASLRTKTQFSSGLELDTDALIARKHELRGESTALIDAASPIPYTDMRARADLTKKFNHLGISGGVAARRLAYENVASLSGGELDQSWRDGTILSAYVKPYYEFSPGYRAFVRIEGNRRDYRGEGDLDRDSHGYDLRAGLDFTLTPLIYGSFEAGYMSQSYLNAAIPPINGLSFRGKASWLVTSLMTLSFSAERSLAETTAPGFAGRLDTSLGARLDYELLRNVILFGGGKLIHEDFRGTGRQDDVLQLSAGFDYLRNRFTRAGVRYDFIARDSTLPLYTFDQHVVTFNVTAQY